MNADSVTAVITGVLSSGVAAGMFTFVLKTYVQGRLKSYFALEMERMRQEMRIELEGVKAELAIQKGEAKEMSDRRLDAYPRFVEGIYRIRNMSREVANDPTSARVLSAELSSRSKALEDDLYHFRIDLEHDDIFHSIHGFKNAAKTFTMLLADLEYVENRHDTSLDEAAHRLKEAYDDLDGLYRESVRKLSEVIGLPGRLKPEAAPTGSS